MLQRLKRSNTGKWLLRVSKRKVVGWPLRKVSNLLKRDEVQAKHLNPVFQAHNRKQDRILAEFESRLDQ